MMRKLQLLAIGAIGAIAFACVNASAQNNLPNLSTDLGASITTNADSVTGNENLVLSGGGAGVPVKPFFIGNNDNAAGTTITIGTGSGATTTINGSTSVGDALAVGGAASIGNSLAVGGSTSVGNSLAVTNSASVGGTLTVNGASSLNGIDNNGQVISNVAPGVASWGSHSTTCPGFSNPS